MGFFLKNYEQALSSYQRMKFAEYRPPEKGLRDFKQFTTRKKTLGLFSTIRQIFYLTDFHFIWATK